MPSATKSCARLGCPNVVTSGRCDECRGQAEQQRGTATQRGYGRAHQRRFRPGALNRDPLCVCDDQAHGHGDTCLAPSTVADHWPLSRRELVEAGMDPDDPEHGRGVCKGCHDRSTSSAQPGGWNAR